MADIDNYSPVHPLMEFLQNMLVYWEWYGGPLLRMVRKWGLAIALDYMKAEDLQVRRVLDHACGYRSRSIPELLRVWPYRSRSVTELCVSRVVFV